MEIVNPNQIKMNKYEPNYCNLREIFIYRINDIAASQNM